MDNNKNEKERKELNKKLLKKTFVSEVKSRRKIKFIEFVIDCIAVFIACFLSDMVVEKLSISNWFLEIAITAGLVMLMLFVDTVLVGKVKKIRGNSGKK